MIKWDGLWYLVCKVKHLQIWKERLNCVGELVLVRARMLVSGPMLSSVLEGEGIIFIYPIIFEIKSHP